MFRGRVRCVHFVGIGGVGMSGIAEVLLANGFQVSGSDLRAGETAQHLRSLGATVHIGHAGAHVGDADVVVYSSAVQSANPELQEATRRRIPVIGRAEMLAELMRLKDGIAIAGSHGKTTTTSLLATVLREAELDPTVVIGGKLNALGTGAARGQGDLLLAEADESDGSFLHLSPIIAVVTNIDPEHLDHYGDLQGVKRAFTHFANRVPFYGLVVACIDSPNLQGILKDIHRRTLTYGLARQAHYRADSVEVRGLTTHFRVHRGGELLGDFEVRMPGDHNVRNALATLAVADELGVSHGVVRDALAGFGGVQRRFTVLGEPDGVTVVDDYGHHPAEIEVTLEAAERAYPGRRIVVAFQPHRYTRTRDLLDDFSLAFGRSDTLLITDVYAAGEQPIEGADGAALVRGVQEHGHGDVHHVPLLDDLPARLMEHLEPGDVVLTLGAGSITRVAPQLVKLLAARRTRGTGGGQEEDAQEE